MTRPITGEPTHKDEDGKVHPGPANLRSTITPQKTKHVDAVQEEFYKDADFRNRYSSFNPQISEPYTPLQNLIWDAFREYGEMNPGTMDGDMALTMLRFANYIVEDLRAHPLWDMPDLDYYISLTDSRPIPDVIMIAGLQHYYAAQQLSDKIQVKQPQYLSRMNTVLNNRRYGNGKIEIEPFK